MADLSHLARQAASKPEFIASQLVVYQQAKNLDDAALANQLGCSLDDLPHLRLCMLPHASITSRRRSIDANIRSSSGKKRDISKKIFLQKFPDVTATVISFELKRDSICLIIFPNIPLLDAIYGPLSKLSEHFSEEACNQDNSCPDNSGKII